MAAAEEAWERFSAAKGLRECELTSWWWDKDPNFHAPIVRDEGGVPHPVTTVFHCHHRLCPECARIRSAHNVARLVDAIPKRFKEREYPPALVTLTQRDVAGRSLAESADGLLAAFKRLRRTKRWLANVNGGVLSCEMTFNPELRSWHVHLHVLVDTHWYAQADLLADWRAALDDEGRGGARIERVRTKPGQTWEDAVVKGVQEALKYTVKGLGRRGQRHGHQSGQSVEELDDERLVELVGWLHSKRLLRMFGCLNKITKLKEDEEDEAADDECLGYNLVTGEMRTRDDCMMRNDPRADEVGYALKSRCARRVKDEDEDEDPGGGFRM